MPMSFAVDPVRGWLVTTATGEITYDDIRAHVLQERASKHLGMRELIDATGATPAFSPAQVRDIVSLLRGLGKNERLGPTAIVVGSDYAFGMMRMLEILLGDSAALRPFRKRDEAEAWLTLAPTAGPGEEARR